MLGLRGVEPNSWSLGSLGVWSLCDITTGLICAKTVCHMTGVLVEQQRNKLRTACFFSCGVDRIFTHNTGVLSGRGRSLWMETEEVLLFRGRTRSRSGCGADSLLH